MQFTPKQARRLADFTQREIAEILGIYRQTYMKMEANPEEFTVKQAYAFADAVGLPYDQIKFFSADNQQTVGNSEKKGG